MFKRHTAGLLFGIYTLISLAFLSWSADQFVQTLKHTFFYLLAPSRLPVVSEMDRWGRFGVRMAQLIRADERARVAEEKWLRERLDEKRLQTLEDENLRLTQLLSLPRWPLFDVDAARVWARDPADWFHSMLVRGGPKTKDWVGNAVVTTEGDRVVAMGQVTETLPGGIARVLLVTDPVSSLSAHVARTGEQGLVEGRSANLLLLNYLFSDSDVKAGDEVVTSGLGEVFPAGILIGRVVAVQEATRGSFKRALIAPAAPLASVRSVLVLSHRAPPEESLAKAKAAK